MTGSRARPHVTLPDRIARVILAIACVLAIAWPVDRALARDCVGGYETRAAANPDSTGRFYLGRETAPVMGHLGAGWLERPDREAEEKPALLIRNLQLKPTDVVADIGAGTGYFSFRIAALVPKGRVIAVDVQPEMLAMIRARRDRAGITNVEPVLGRIDDPALAPDSVDLALMVDVYHEFSHPCEMMAALVRALKPGGRLALVEYRGEDANVPIKRLHKMTRAQAIREIEAAGLRSLRTVDALPWQHLMFFEKPAGPIAR